jgi:hypothetical protein
MLFSHQHACLVKLAAFPEKLLAQILSIPDPLTASGIPSQSKYNHPDVGFASLSGGPGVVTAEADDNVSHEVTAIL